MEVMTEEQVRERGWLNKPKSMVMGKIVCSMEACPMMHPSAHASNQSLPGGQANMAPGGDAQIDEVY